MQVTANGNEAVESEGEGEEQSPEDEGDGTPEEPEEDARSFDGEGKQYDSDEYALEELEPFEERVGAIRDSVDPHEAESCRAMTDNQRKVAGTEPFRSHIEKKDRSDDRPKFDASEKQCLAAYVMVNQARAYTLFDSGSTTDMVAPDFARVMKIPTFKLEQPVTIRLGCVGSRSAIHSGARANIQVGDSIARNVYLDVANVDRYDLILGNKFMYDMNIILDIHERTIYVNGLEGCKLGAAAPGFPTLRQGSKD
jgi:hypothetical protein